MFDANAKRPPFDEAPDRADGADAISPQGSPPVNAPDAHPSSETQEPALPEALRDALLHTSQKDLARLPAEELSRLFSRSGEALKERRARDRKEAFQELADRLLKTDIIRTLREGDEAERREAVRDVKEFFCSLGFRVSLEALEKFTRVPEKKAPPRKEARSS